MSDAQHATSQTWGLILAAGEGSRLRALTTQPGGTPVPKQYCSLRGGRSLLEEALQRAAPLVPAERLCVIVAQQHRNWWSGMDALGRLPQRNLIVQPRNRGTAIGILYSLLHILGHDPQARVLLLPADHYVTDESILEQSLRAALDQVERDPNHPVLLGLHPEDADTDLGYIIPGTREEAGGRRVARFVEKPDVSLAEDIVRAGGLWNTFIIAAAARSLMDLFLPRYAPVVMEMQVIVSRALSAGAAAGWPAIVDMYTRLPDLDFSRALLEGNESMLRVTRVPPCGWSDLGTPQRVGMTLRRLPSVPAVSDETADLINLAARHAHLERTAPPGASV